MNPKSPPLGAELGLRSSYAPPWPNSSPRCRRSWISRILFPASTSFCALLFFRLPALGLRIGRHQNLRHVHARLGQIEAGLVGLVECGDIGVGDDDVRSDVLVDELLNAQLAADLGLEIVQRHLVVAKLLLELLFGPGRLQLGQLRFDVGVAGQQALLFGALQHDLAVDQAAQHFQFLRHGLLARPGRAWRAATADRSSPTRYK
jgi:hypothetical protein